MTLGCVTSLGSVPICLEKEGVGRFGGEKNRFKLTGFKPWQSVFYAICKHSKSGHDLDLEHGGVILGCV